MKRQHHELNRRLNIALKTNLSFLIIPLFRFLSELGRNELIALMRRILTVLKEDIQDILNDYEIRRTKR